MYFRSSEDRLNPITPEGVDDTTLGGYPAVHGRAPAFEGSDGEPYTVAIEAERADDGDGWVSYLVFLRWSATGSAVMGHIETGDLERGGTEQQARDQLGAYLLSREQDVLDAAIRRRSEEADLRD